jgi:hypothetical protein
MLLFLNKPHHNLSFLIYQFQIRQSTLLIHHHQLTLAILLPLNQVVIHFVMSTERLYLFVSQQQMILHRCSLLSDATPNVIEEPPKN